MNISREFHAHSGNYRGGGNSCRYIVVHNTGNTASARNEASYAQNDHHKSSYHYVLDGNECYQILDDVDTAWAVGAWSGAVQYIRNNQSISIEVVSSGTEFTDAEKSMLRELVLSLMSKHGISADKVVRHWDCHSGRKQCPAFYSGSNNAAWNDLHAYITGGTAEAPVTAHAPSGDFHVYMQANNGRVLGVVKDDEDNAGIDAPMLYLAAWGKGFDLLVRVADNTGRTYSWLTNPSDINNHATGCCGNGHPITKIWMYSHFPNADHRIWYRVKTARNGWLSWIKDNIDTGGSSDSFAGDGSSIWRIEAHVGGL